MNCYVVGCQKKAILKLKTLIGLIFGVSRVSTTMVSVVMGISMCYYGPISVFLHAHGR